MIHPPHASVVCSEDHQRQSLNTTYWESREDVKEVLSWERSYNSRHNSFQYYHASIVCHENGKPVTNHLFLKPPGSGPFTRKQEATTLLIFGSWFSNFLSSLVIALSLSASQRIYSLLSTWPLYSGGGWGRQMDRNEMEPVAAKVRSQLVRKKKKKVSEEV